MPSVGSALTRLLEQCPDGVDLGATYRQPCGEIDLGAAARLEPGRTYCDGERHREGDGPVGAWCPVALRRQAEARVAGERVRLGATLERLHRESGSVGFRGFAARDDADRALYGALHGFAQERPPRRGLFIAGSTGRGKTRLMLAAHFALLRAGLRSVYATPGALRDWMRGGDEGDGWLRAMRSADVVFFDDFGSPGDESFRGKLASELKEILDESRAVWVTATNLTAQQLLASPDCNEQILSRLRSCASVVKLSGPDWRTGAR